MLIEDFYKLILRDKKLYVGLKDYAKVNPDTFQLIDVTGLTQVDPYKEIGILNEANIPNTFDFEYLSLRPTIYKVNPAHNLEVELPFDTCLVKFSEADLSDPDFKKGEMYILLCNEEGSTETLIIAFAVIPHMKLVAEHKLFVLKQEQGIAMMFDPGTTHVKELLPKKERDKKNAMLLDVIIQCIATLKKCNKSKTNLYTTTPAKGKGVKINGKFTDISKKPIYIYTERNVNEKKAQSFTRGNPVEHCICWPVRGHWRRLDDPKKRGKDIHGNYVIEGMTWVKPTVKGNKDMPLRQRTYIAKESK